MHVVKIESRYNMLSFDFVAREEKKFSFAFGVFYFS